MLNAFTREAIVAGVLWQWVGDTIDDGRTVTVRTGYKVDGRWTHFPPIRIETRDDEPQEARFNEFVDHFLQQAKENG